MSTSRKVYSGLGWGVAWAEAQPSPFLQHVLSRATRSWTVGLF